MLEKAYKPAKPDRAGKNYRPEEEKVHTFFFKGYYIIISSDLKKIRIAEVRNYLPPIPNNTLDEALVKGMEEVYRFRDEDYEKELQKIEEEEKEKQIRKQLEPLINTIIKEIQTWNINQN